MANPQLDIDVVEALLAAMHTGGNGGSDMYDDDDDDDDYDEEEDDDNEDDDSYYDGETIETLINSYGGAGGDIANMGDVADGGMPAHTMNLLQGLLSMNAPNMAAELEAALGSGGSGGMASLGGAMEGAAAAAAAFLPNMQIPNMGSDMQGAIVGALGAGSAMIEGYQQAGYGQYDDDDDDDEDDDDDSIPTSEEDDEDDDEESLRGHPHLGMEAAMLGGMGGAMAGGMLANVAGNFLHRSSYTEAIRHLPSPHVSEAYRHSPQVSESYKHLPPPHVQNASLPSMMSQAAFAAAAAVVGSAATAMSGNRTDSRLALPQTPKTFVPPNGVGPMPMLLSPPNSRPNQAALPPIPPNQTPINSGQMPSALSPYTSRPMPHSSTPALGFCLPNQPSSAVQPMPIAHSVSTPLPSSQPSYTCVSTTHAGTMSGGSVSRNDPLALLMNGASGAALGGLFQANVSNLLGKSGGTTIVNNKAISASRIHTSLPSPIGNAKALDNMTSVTVKLAATSLECSTSRNLKQLMPPPPAPATIPCVKNSAPMGATKNADTIAPLALNSKKECDDDNDKTSVSSSGSEGSGGGKSDTESVGKKTPSPPPESDEATCGSIPDLTSATESMRDSDTDNHSEAHNMTANLSDVDSDVHEQQQQQQQYQQQMQQLLYQQQQHKAYTPFLIERPSTSWSNMEGVDNAKDALKNLFTAKDFPAVFEGTEGSCRGVLLFGPPFSGKTHLARSLPKEVNASVFVAVNFQELFSNSYVMQTDFAKVISLMFENARRERPAVILFDQIEHLCQPHPIVKCAKDELLAQVRGQSLLHQKIDPTANDGIFVIATTNKPCMLQDDILRSIFAYNIHVKLPDEKARHNILGMSLQKLPHNINEEQLQCLVSKSEGYSMIDMNTVIKKALMKKNPSYPMNTNALITIDDVTTEMTNYVCPYTDELKESYVSYISAATHKATKGGDTTDEASKEKKDKPKKKKISHRIAKSLAAVVLAVID